MSLFTLPEPGTQHRLIGNAIRSLARAEKALIREAELAGKLAIMLVATGRPKDAEALLDSAITHGKYDGDESRWGAFGACIVIRSHLARTNGDPALADRLMARIARDEIFAVERGRQRLAEEWLEDHESEFEIARAETPAHAIDALAGRICDYLYFIESDRGIYHDLPPEIVERFEGHKDESIAEIARRLS